MEDKKEKLKKWKEKFLNLVKLGKSDQDILKEMNEGEKTLNSLSEVRRLKHQIRPEDE